MSEENVGSEIESSSTAEQVVAESPPLVNLEDMALPLLPLKNTVLYPHMFLPLAAGRDSSMAAVEAALASEEKAFVAVAQRNAEVEEPGEDDLFSIGTRAVIKKMARTPERVEILVQGIDRVRIVAVEQTTPFLKVKVEVVPLPEDHTTETEALFREILEQARRAFELAQPESGVQVEHLLAQAGDPLRMIYMLGSMLSLEVGKEQALLEAKTRLEAMQLLHESMTHELQVLEIRHKISSKAQTEMSKEQREYMLRRQMQAIQEELGEQSPEKAEVAALRQRLEEISLPEAVRKETNRELSRLERLPPAAPDFQIIRTYLDLVLELPWDKSTEDNLDLNHARNVLDEDHFDLADVKERILEHLAVLKLNPNANAPILCFVGPPGVGKTSLGQSIARSMGRQFERASLGGMSDEAELRGHRRTYIGAMPGRVIQAIRRAGVKNPVLMLDEIDKLGRDYRGDPAAALLEILDPAQNTTFRDNYLDLPFDLSQVFFVCTANTLDTIPRPLLDRMEILRLSGYTAEEKVEIARRYLVPRQIKITGLSTDVISFTDDGLQKIINDYTREAGVRRLEQAIGRICRKTAMQVAEEKCKSIPIEANNISEFLGPEVFVKDRAREVLPAGVIAGLAWTETGGEVLYVEASLLPNGRGLKLTGQLGKVMKESARAALSYLWSHTRDFGIKSSTFRKSGVHIHVPAGAVPKDGPSAGVAMITALASLFTDLPARSDTAMTGEITLSGLVFPIGGVKEKVLAARTAGMKHVILPKANEKDTHNLPDEVKTEMTIHFAETIEDVLKIAIPGLHMKKK